MKNPNIQEQIDQEDSFVSCQKSIVDQMTHHISYRDLMPPEQDRVASEYRPSGFLQGGLL